MERRPSFDLAAQTIAIYPTGTRASTPSGRVDNAITESRGSALLHPWLNACAPSGRGGRNRRYDIKHIQSQKLSHTRVRPFPV